MQPLNITVSYSSLLRLLDKIGENHDARVKSWKHAIVDQMKNSEVKKYLQSYQLIMCILAIAKYVIYTIGNFWVDNMPVP